MARGTAAGAISCALLKPPSPQSGREGCTDTDKSREFLLILISVDLSSLVHNFSVFGFWTFIGATLVYRCLGVMASEFL